VSDKVKQGYGFWQVQDKVPASVIQHFTKNCKREDCCISYRVRETTLAGFSDWYDKQGNFHIEDRNRFTGTICCCKCWRSGLINSMGEMLEEYPLERDKICTIGPI
jgi:hypothetical protein